jgi:hypothetical protein
MNEFEREREGACEYNTFILFLDPFFALSSPQSSHAHHELPIAEAIEVGLRF